MPKRNKGSAKDKLLSADTKATMKTTVNLDETVDICQLDEIITDSETIKHTKTVAIFL